MENKNMRKLNVTVQCMAVYNSSIMVPRELTFEEAIKYAKEHIDEINLGELEYISDSDELDEENCDFDEEEDPTLIVWCFMKLALRSQKSLAPGQRTAMLYISLMKSVPLKNSITVDGTICTG